jgi:hypothetical protein
VTPELIKEMNLTSLGGFMKRVMEGVEPLKHYLGLQDDCTMQFAVYPGKGEGYNRHKDAFPIPVEKERSDAYASNCNDGSSSNTRPIGRQLTCLFYLNKDWEPEDGGQLRVFTPTGAFIEGGGNLFNFWGCNGYDIEPLFGRLVIFRSEIVEHAVLPCHRERMALTLWITGSGPSSSERGTLQGEEKEMGLFSFASNTVDDTGSDDDTSSAEDRSVRIEETDNNNSNSNSNNVGDGDIAVEK